MNSTSYLNLIKDQISKHAKRIAGTDFVFQQDNAAYKLLKHIFHARILPFWNDQHAVKHYLPDLNIIENCWRELARAIYKDEKNNMGTLIS